MVRCVIVEDEITSREVLKTLLSQYCSDVMVVAEAFDVRSGRIAVQNNHPDLLFLDIEMPDGSGFNLLSGLDNIDFEVIFTTAYDQYAIKAIRFAALDYLLKPISPDELVAAVEKVKIAKHKKNIEKQYDVLLKNIGTAAIQTKKITLSTADKIHVVAIDDIVSCESDNYYTIFKFLDGGSLMVTKTLKEVEKQLEEYDFVRTHKSHLVNVKYLKNFLRDEMLLVMVDGSKIPVSRRKKEKIMEIINNL